MHPPPKFLKHDLKYFALKKTFWSCFACREIQKTWPKQQQQNLSSHGGFESSHPSCLILSTRRKAGHSDRHSTDFIWPLPIFFCVSTIWFLFISPRDFFFQWIINYSLCQFSMTIEFCRNLPTIELSICKKWFGT